MHCTPPPSLVSDELPYRKSRSRRTPLAASFTFFPLLTNSSHFNHLYQLHALLHNSSLLCAFVSFVRA